MDGQIQSRRDLKAENERLNETMLGMKAELMERRAKTTMVLQESERLRRFMENQAAKLEGYRAATKDIVRNLPVGSWND